VDTSRNIEDEDMDVEESLEAIMEDTLSRVEKLSTSHGTTSMASIRGMTKKKQICMQQHLCKYFISAQI
jgi:hypothetical protein